MSQYSGMQMPILKDASDTEQVRRMGLDLLSYINQLDDKTNISIAGPGIISIGMGSAFGYIPRLGYYLETSTGLLICYNYNSSATTCSNAINGTSAGALGFPILFLSAPVVVGIAQKTTGATGWCTATNPTTSSVNLVVFSNSSSATVTAGYIAIGRYK